MKSWRNRLTAIAMFGTVACFGQGPGNGPIRVAESIETAVVGEPLDPKVNTQFIEYGPTLERPLIESALASQVHEERL